MLNIRIVIKPVFSIYFIAPKDFAPPLHHYRLRRAVYTEGTFVYSDSLLGVFGYG